MTVPVVLIAAVARNGAIGLRDALPWRLPSDLAGFRAETMGKPVVMGRKTFAALGRPGPGRPPLAGRHLVVLSRDREAALPEGVAGAADLAEALSRAQAIAARHGAAEVMVAGGAEVYRAAMPFADALRITEVDLAPDADTFFPPIDPALWREASRVSGERGARDEAAFAVVRYGRAGAPGSRAD